MKRSPSDEKTPIENNDDPQITIHIEPQLKCRTCNNTFTTLYNRECKLCKTSRVLDDCKRRLNEEQNRVFSHCFDKPDSNMFITGQAGSGKSFLIKAIQEYAESIGRLLFVTALTGCAAIDIGGTTFHSYMGIGIGDEPYEEYRRKMSNDTKNRIKDTQMLLIDEISMMNPEYFELAEHLLRAVRDNDLPFGGIQTILVGDFLQLPPVNDDGSKSELRYAFQSDLWTRAQFQPFLLSQNHRQQSDPVYAQFLSKMRTGQLSRSDFDSVIISIKKNPSPPTPDESCHIYSKCKQVSYYNNMKLNLLSGELHKFTCSGTNCKEMLKYVRVDEVISLKVGTQVMLCRNINVAAGLYNGKRGVVVDFVPSTTESIKDTLVPLVKFSDGLQTTIEYSKWELKRNVKEANKYTYKAVATLIQIPLILAWAITVHKTQGMTMDAITINGGFFEKGHAYVAFSRVKRQDSISIGKNIPFSEVKTDPVVVKFYKESNLLLQ